MVSCSNGKYPSSGQCHLCDHTCAQCVDAGPANCTSCDTGQDSFLIIVQMTAVPITQLN